jgi:hypothetical protein
MNGRNGFAKNAPTGFTVVVCDTCDDEPADLAVLRQTIRQSPHGMLVRAQCPLGRMWCHTRKTSGESGRVVLVQPCTTARAPLGAAIFVGPVCTADDLAAVARWLETSPTDAAALPPHLREILHPRHQSTRN